MSSPPDLSPSDQDFLGLLEQVTRSGNDWRLGVQAMIANPDQDSIAACKEAYGRIQAHVMEYFTRALGLVNTNPTLRRWWGDVLTQLIDQWDEIAVQVSKLDVASPQTSKTIGIQCLASLDDSGYAATFITIPPRLEDILTPMAVGDNITFDNWFSDEIPNPDYRKRFLQSLSDQALLVDGYVDIDAGTITRVSSSLLVQWSAIGIAVILIGACAAALYGLEHWGSALGLPQQGKRPRADVILVDAGLVWLGMFAHIALAWYKGFRREGPTVPRSARRILYVISARQLAIWVAIIVGAVLTYVFACSGRVTEPAAMFAVGYSADSLIDTLTPRFDSTLAKLASTLPGPAAT